MRSVGSACPSPQQLLMLGQSEHPCNLQLLRAGALIEATCAQCLEAAWLHADELAGTDRALRPPCTVHWVGLAQRSVYASGGG